MLEKKRVKEYLWIVTVKDIRIDYVKTIEHSFQIPYCSLEPWSDKEIFSHWSDAHF